MGLFAGAPAHAQAQPFPANSDVTITKLTQPETLGDAATGQEEDLPVGADPVQGVVFNAYFVRSIDDNEDQQAVASAVPSDFDISGIAPVVFPATNASGVATVTNLERGLYVIAEDPSTVPAGVTASAPFMLTVPLTDPENLNRWLDHIYIYPKNSQVSVEKAVDNAAAHVVGNDVTWTITADIPRVENPASTGATDQFQAPDYFRVDDQIQSDQLVLNPEFAAGSNGAISVEADGTSLNETEHYVVTEAPAEGGVTGYNYQIVFTPAGREALAIAVNANPTAQVSIEISTTVLSTGRITNTANLYPNQDSVDQANPLADAEEIRYGGYNFQKLSTDSDLEDLSGAQFRVYDSLDDAEERTGHLEPSIDPAGGLWTTNAAGELSITGLRYSNFANGETIAPGHEDYVTYYLVEVTALPGHQLLASPIEFHVLETTGVSEPWEADEEITNQATSGAFVLPLTGGTGTWLLTLAGIALLILVVVIARRRAATEA